ncbi:MAG: VOC family protein [bacterium]|nr:VOC family protein [bacterium]
MSDEMGVPIGTVGWFDLTVEDAEGLRDFYGEVAGWSYELVPMEGYDDYLMINRDGGVVAGICHARGPNTGLPPRWLAYVTVADLEASLEACAARGGRVIAGPRSLGEYGTFCVICDPAGAHVALLQPLGDEARDERS